MGKLNALSVKAAKEPGRYQDGDGLMLLVKGNSRSWLLRIQVNGRRRDFGLGSANHVGLAEAREKANALRRSYLAGVDPVKAKRAARLAAVPVPTFAEAADALFEEQRASWKNAKHRAQWISSLRAYAAPFIGSLPIDKIDGPMIREALLPIWLEKPETARRVRQRIGTVLDWAYSKGLRSSEAPMRALSKGLPRQPKSDRHFAALSHDRVRELVTDLSKSDTVGRLALRFLIFTAARSGEVRGATWDEIDLQLATWTVPAERMKAGREHIVPLSAGALDVLEIASRLRTGRLKERVFPGASGRPLSDMTLTKALRASEGGKATVHGFRSSFRDWAAEETSHAGEVVEAALAHTIANRVEAAYRRTNYLQKRRTLMSDWAKYVGANA